MDGSRWKLKTDPVLVSEFKLMERKEQKLKNALQRDSQMVEKQRERLGVTVQALNIIEDSYYRRYVQKEPTRATKNVTFASKPLPDKETAKHATPVWPNTRNTGSAKSLRVSRSHQRPDGETAKSGLSQKRRIANQNCESYPNTSDYIKRILDPKDYLHAASNQTDPPLDGPRTVDKSLDRRRVSVDDESVQHRSDAGAPVSNRRPASAKGAWRRPPSSQKKGFARGSPASPSQDDEDSEPQYLDLVEYMSEEQALRDEHDYHSHLAHHSDHHNKSSTKTGGWPKPGKSEARFEHAHDDASSSQISHEKPSVSRHTQVHPKQVSYENALKLREGKIFAKFDKELKIYDLRDLDCKIGVDVHLLRPK